MIPSKYWKYFVLILLWVVSNYYYPNMNTKNAEYLAWQFGCLGLFAVSCLFDQVRKSRNIIPGLFVILAIVSVFTHGIHAVYLEGLTQVLMFAIAFYSIVNTTKREDVGDIKKAIVLIAVLNSFMGISQCFGYSPIFNTNQITGFIGLKFNLGIFCAAALPLALEWNILTALPIIACILLCDKYAIYISVLVLLFCNEQLVRIPKKKLIWIALAFIFAAVCVKTEFFKVHPELKNHVNTFKNGLKEEWDLKIIARFYHWGGIIKYCGARLIDGWGFSSYSNHVWNKDIPGQVEMHNEWLNMLFEAGALGLALVFGWVNYIRKRVNARRLDGITSCLLVFAVASVFHSCLHTPNLLFVFVVALAVWEIERGASQSVSFLER